MNYWTSLSIEYANQRNYLDDLFRVYPLAPEGIRDIDQDKWATIEQAYNRKDKPLLLRELLSLELFPLKDSYVAYLKRDPSALDRNPATVDRLCGRLFEIGLTDIFEKCTQPKETNRQIGPLFKRWLNSGSLGVDILSLDDFVATNKNAILGGGDAQLMDFAKIHLNYKRSKGLDFIARFNGKYIVGEAKFLSDFGGHQNAQFEDAMSLLQTRAVKAIKIAVLDGVLYIKSNNKMHKFLRTNKKQYNIMSALVLREFLYHV